MGISRPNLHTQRKFTQRYKLKNNKNTQNDLINLLFSSCLKKKYPTKLTVVIVVYSLLDDSQRLLQRPQIFTLNRVKQHTSVYSYTYMIISHLSIVERETVISSNKSRKIYTCN